MTEIQEMGEKGTSAVKMLRIKKLQNGLPFMINSRDLPSNQCYLEYPDGTIKLVRIAESARDFTFIRELSQDEANSLRAKYNLSDFNNLII